MAVLAALACVAAAPLAADFRPPEFTSGSWSATCDNARTCTTLTDLTAGAGYVVVRSDPGATPRIALAIAVPRYDTSGPPAPLSLVVDGRSVSGQVRIVGRPVGGDQLRAVLDGASSAALLPVLRRGQSLTVSGAGGSQTFSLTGLTASLIWIDERRRDRLDPPPVYVAARPVSQARLPKDLPRSIAVRPELADCAGLTRGQYADQLVFRLGPDTLLWGVLCNEAASHYSVYSLYLTDARGGRVRPVHLPQGPLDGENLGVDGQVANPEYDPRRQRLVSLIADTTFGECGQRSEWVWDSRAFRLIGQTTHNDCLVRWRDWPSVWQARVK